MIVEGEETLRCEIMLDGEQLKQVSVKIFGLYVGRKGNE